MIEANLQIEPLDILALTQIINDASKGAGAIVTFTGCVRDYNEQGSIDAIELEHYPGMTEKALHNLANNTLHSFSCQAVSIAHRYGRINNFEPIVWVGVASEHRKAAFDAACFAMDTLKNNVPLWKKEWRGEQADWVKAKQTDVEAFNLWQEDKKTRAAK